MSSKTTPAMTNEPMRIFQSFLRNTLIISAVICLGIAGLDAIFPFHPQIRSGTVVTDNNGKALTAFLSPDDKWRFPVRLTEVSPVFIKAVILKEDKRFRWHFGIDPLAIARASLANLLQGRRTSGASTITMQVARLLEPRPRTLWSKLIEALHAVQLEMHYSKDEILEMYLWLIPYGGNVEGIRAATMFYLGTSPDRLSAAEAAALLVVPNRPTSLRLGGDDASLRSARNTWIERLRTEGILDDDAAAAALSEPVVLRRTPTPRRAWHLSVRLASASATDGVVRSSIDGTMQHAVEALTHRHVERLRMMGITNASVIVVDNATRRVVSYVGSADPTDVPSMGQVDGVRAIRSPGSTLKPFIYALAVDRGLMTPRTMLEDVPVSFDGYAPENFDRTYMGAMTMERALAMSRNVPAVSTLERIGIASLLDMLHRADVRSVARQRTGLSIALGGCGIQLDELVGLYAALANGGLWSPLVWTANAQQRADTVRLISRPSAYMISDVLTTASRPDLPNGVDVSADLPRIAWKTGTSYGRRDAWSIGYNRRYTVGVWVGNFDGSGNEMLTGSQCATPLLFDVFRSIDHSMDDRWLERPASLDLRFVCALSGLPPADSCTNQMLDAFIPGVSTGERCRHQREMYVDRTGRRSYCTSCLPQTGWIRSMELDMPAPVLAYMRENGVALRMPPPHDPQCTRVFEGSLRITAPSDGKEYVLERDIETKLRCMASAESDVSTVYWFLDDVFVTSTPAGSATFVTPKAGRHVLECVDDRGRRARCTFTIRYW